MGGAHAFLIPAVPAVLLACAFAARGDEAQVLQNWVVDAVSGGERPTVYLEMMGPPVRAKVRAAGENGIDVKFAGVESHVPWERLPPRRFAALAARYAEGRPAEEQIALVVFARENGMEEMAEEHATRILALAPELRDRLEPKAAEKEPASPAPWLPARPPPAPQRPSRPAAASPSRPAASQRRPVSKEHPRLLGSRQELRLLAQERRGLYQQAVRVARRGLGDAATVAITRAVVNAVEPERDLARKAIEHAMSYVRGPIRVGHVTFGHDLAAGALVYDMCHEFWTEEEKKAFHEYVNKTVDANRGSELHVFHNGYYGYKNWGIGLACYATMYENPRAAEILKGLDADIRERALPALDRFGDGGGWGEGFYTNSCIYEWIFFCEAARRCEGVDYYALAPKFFANRAVATMFESYPGILDYRTRRPIPMGDAWGQVYGSYRDRNLSVRRILASYYRDDPAHRAVHAFNQTTPRLGAPDNAYMDFLWHDRTVAPADLRGFKLSHVSQGPGYVYARSSWDEDATYFFFKCGDRFTAHQHLDVGHFLIFKHKELAGDGGQYDSFASNHCVNYYLRSIAHSTVLVHDPSERWPRNLRAGPCTGNDGGQSHAWRHHNGAFADPDDWTRSRNRADIGDIIAFEDRGAYMYVAGDCTRAYSRKKLAWFTRQIVFIRPATFVIFDRVRSKSPHYKKTWLLQAAKPPTGQAPNLVVTNGRGRLFIQTLWPRNPEVRLFSGKDLYSYGGASYPPGKSNGPAPECRIEISPSVPATDDVFLHVLTATGSGVSAGPAPELKAEANQLSVTVANATVTFPVAAVGGSIEISAGGSSYRGPLATRILTEPERAR